MYSYVNITDKLKSHILIVVLCHNELLSSAETANCSLVLFQFLYFLQSLAHFKFGRFKYN